MAGAGTAERSHHTVWLPGSVYLKGEHLHGHHDPHRGQERDAARAAVIAEIARTDSPAGRPEGHDR
ncbi:hypothetical protein [Streptomyces katsurahamanus]|uniref:Uncharacterized protein n=1 Tax=Streptomyces katsurahamanus TaxID=2577098 RepID=A0ABW9NP86_9ACTN|nr:hypothetical protein [Streptomyces katsurahamanus]MQS35120.1 hypothetical protein [Streptomyces katsurahamanus]